MSEDILFKVNHKPLDGAPDYLFWCPGCECSHGIWTEGPHKWEWNGSLNKPTFTPSIKVGFDPEGRKICHSFVNNGRIQFLTDSWHKLKGQTVDLVPADSVDIYS